MKVMAGGTSLPELATCIVAALKKRGQMALGNVLGSNVSNILLIIGGSAVITPQTMGKVTFLSLFVMAFVSILIFVTAFTFKKKQLDRWEGLLPLIIVIWDKNEGNPTFIIITVRPSGTYTGISASQGIDGQALLRAHATLNASH